MEMADAAETDEQKEALTENEDYTKITKKYAKLYQQKKELDVEPNNNGDFVWLFRRK